MVMHSALLASDLGLPIGLASQEIWVRPQEAEPMEPAERRKLPIEQKESNKWLAALSQTPQAPIFDGRSRRKAPQSKEARQSKIGEALEVFQHLSVCSY